MGVYGEDGNGVLVCISDDFALPLVFFCQKCFEHTLALPNNLRFTGGLADYSLQNGVCLLDLLRLSVTK